MSFLVEKDEATAGRRTVPFRLFTSNGTAPDTGASTDTLLMSVNGGGQLSAGSISAVSANAGMYAIPLTQSAVSVLGSLALWYDLGDFPQHVATVQVVNSNPFSTQSNVANVSIVAGTYSGVTVGVNNLAAGSYSGVTVQGVTRVNSSVTPANAEYSAITVRLGLVDYSGATLGAGNLAPGAYSGVSVEVTAGGIQSVSFGGNAIDAAALAADTGQEVADALLGRNVAGGSSTGRTVTQALYAIRNRVQISGSTGTVYATDDTTSSWTFSITTVGSQAISQIDPGGA